MPDYKIESNIPLPDPDPVDLDQDFDVPDNPPELHLEDTRGTPFKPHQKKCRAGKHSPEIGRCAICGDVFPCPSGNCGHFDCADPSLAGLDCKGNGTEVPDWIEISDVVVEKDLMSRADSGEIQITQEDSESESVD